MKRFPLINTRNSSRILKNEIVKILGRGELKAKLTVTAHKFTATAKAAIEAAGGEAVTL